MSTKLLEGRRLLVVEDEFLIAVTLAEILEADGAQVIGPFGNVEDALEAITTSDPDGAVLDVHLGRERIFPVADVLMERKVPFVFLTGYDKWVIPETYRDAVRFEKPADSRAVAKALAAQFVDRPGG